MKSLGYFFVVCLFGLFLFKPKQKPEPLIKMAPKTVVLKPLDDVKVEAFKRKEVKKLDSIADKVQRNIEYLNNKNK
jgi:hypothetical protein